MSIASLRRRIARIALTGLVPLALATGAVVTTAQPAAASTNCSADCISSHTATAKAYDVTFSVNTTVPTKVDVFISNQQAWGNAFNMATSYTLKTSHSPLVIGGLRPSTNYFYHVRAHDAQGRVRIESGTLVRTKTRKLTVTVTKVMVLDDSDALGNGEMYMHGRVVGSDYINGKYVSYAQAAPNLVVNANWGTGGTYTVNRSFVVTNPPPNSRIDIQLADEDSCVPPASFLVKQSGCYQSGVTGTLYPSIPASLWGTNGGLYNRAYGGVDFDVWLTYKLELVN